MRLEGLSLATSALGHELSARAGGRLVWFRLPPGEAPPARVEPFVPAALLAAMACGEPLEVAADLPVSPRLLGGLTRAQEIVHAWVPALRAVPVKATPGEAPAGRGSTAALFSGGVDSCYTVLKHAQEVSHLVLIHGLEITLDNEPLFEEARRSAAAFAADMGLTLAPVRTNLRELAAAHRLGNHLFHGAILAGAALTAGHATSYLASSSTYARLIPWGSHPLLDPLWSTEACLLVHDGAEARRTEKVALLAGCPPALRTLRVCLENGARYNCGRCEKCLRTMVTLHLLGVEAPTLPPLPPPAVLRRTPPDPGGADVRENIDLAERTGHREIANALRASLRRSELRRFAREADDLLLGGFLKAAYRRLRPARPEPAFIDIPG
jgi:hypothetical protein